jgi:hypothetical protein
MMCRHVIGWNEAIRKINYELRLQDAVVTLFSPFPHFSLSIYNSDLPHLQCGSKEYKYLRKKRNRIRNSITQNCRTANSNGR